jgi:hypothetical protein
LGKPVIAYDHGGVAEQLRALFPQGLLKPGDVDGAVDLTCGMLKTRPCPTTIEAFTLRRMLDSTLDVYQTLLASPRPSRS